MRESRVPSRINEAVFKVIIVGNSGVGKSCLIGRYVKDSFQDQHKVTIGVEFSTMTVPLADNYRVKLQLWDTAGQQTFKAITRTFYRNAAAVVLAFDITERQVTRAEAEHWMKEKNIQIYFETSAKTSVNVKELFEQIANQLFLKQLHQKRTSIIRPQQDNIESRIELHANQLDKQNTNNSKRCCFQN